MKNAFLAAFYSMEEQEATKQIGVFLETIKINIEGIELTPSGIKAVREHINSLTTLSQEIKDKDGQ